MTSDETASVAGLRTSEQDGVLVAVVSGELDVDSVDRVGAALFELADREPDGLVVELAVDFMGSSALSMLLELHSRTQRDGVGFAIVAEEVAASRPLMASALTEVLPLAESVDAAVKTIREDAS
ncbi:STAS domain-containing protein [Lentzea sp. NPDC060358]|uniref:STAS domain-containing protein n=1 Tax=Lentzea sp. NPDC060358 TaxID=3347103 RepID=UPI00365A6FB5